MKLNFFINIFVHLLVFCILILPLSSIAQDTNLIVCDPKQPNANNLPDCGFNQLIQLGINLINFLIVLAVPLAAISFVWAGVLLLTSGGSESARDKAKTVATKTGWGLIIVIGAWVIVKTILVVLLGDDSGYSLLTF